jgi:transposase-like protein
VITGTPQLAGGGPAEVKSQIVAESLAPGAQVSDLARRHGIRPQQLFGWRREAREGRLPMPHECALASRISIEALPVDLLDPLLRSVRGPVCLSVCLSGPLER